MSLPRNPDNKHDGAAKEVLDRTVDYSQTGCGVGMLYGALIAVTITVAAFFWPLAIIPIGLIVLLVAGQISQLLNMGAEDLPEEAPTYRAEASRAPHVAAYAPAATPPTKAAPKPASPLQRQTRTAENARTGDSVRDPGKLLFKKATFREILYVHENGLLLYDGIFRPKLVRSIPIQAVSVETREERNGWKLTIRDADGSVFHEFSNLFAGDARKTKERIEDAQK